MSNTPLPRGRSRDAAPPGPAVDLAAADLTTNNSPQQASSSDAEVDSRVIDPDFWLFCEALSQDPPDLGILEGFEPPRAFLNESWTEPPTKLDDHFFGYYFEQLIGSINALVRAHLRVGQEGRVVHHMVSPFGLDTVVKGSTALEQYVEMVARPDMAEGDSAWDELISRDAPRVLLVVAVILRVLDDQIFSKLLFGASKADDSTLWDQDLGFIQEDGFSRSRLRAATVDMLLRRTDYVPPEFWNRVDELSYSILAQLRPIIAFVDLAKRELPGSKPTDIMQLYEDIYEVVGSAAWLSVQARRSESIISFEWPRPGDIFEPSMSDVGADILKRSRRLVEANASVLGMEGKLRRVARISIAVCPEIRRYTLLEDGHVDFKVVRAKIACYWGHQGDIADRDEFTDTSTDLHHNPSLVQYARTKRRQVARMRRGKRGKRGSKERAGRSLLMAVLMVLGLLLLGFVGWEWHAGHLGRDRDQAVKTLSAWREATVGACQDLNQQMSRLLSREAVVTPEVVPLVVPPKPSPKVVHIIKDLLVRQEPAE